VLTTSMPFRVSLRDVKFVVSSFSGSEIRLSMSCLSHCERRLAVCENHLRQTEHTASPLLNGTI
jgi:hypothetical protein